MIYPVQRTASLPACVESYEFKRTRSQLFLALMQKRGAVKQGICAAKKARA